MKVFRIGDMPAGEAYHEFLRVPALSAGIYRHPVGDAVPQQPHTEDEVYHVISGRGRIALGGTDHDVEGGTVVYVPAGVPHHFHAVTEPLEVLVLFAPAEGTGRPPEG